MKIAVIQFDILWGNPSSNRNKIEEIIRTIPSCDVIVLPEMFTTGFAMDPDAITTEPEQDLEWMSTIAKRCDCTICGSIIQKKQGQYFNSFIFSTPEGTNYQYDKRHLFGFGGEKKCYKPGTESLEIEWRNVRFKFAVCYDLRFPSWLRNHPIIPYDVLICVANWPVSRRNAWDILLQARAIENQCYVIGCNRLGKDAGCIYNGGSKIISPKGEILSACMDDKENYIIEEIDMEKLYSFREKFPVLNDAD